MKSSTRIALCIVGLSMGIASKGFCEDTQVTTTAPESPRRTAFTPSESFRCADYGGPKVENIRRILSEPLKGSGLEFTDEPLENVLTFLQDEYQIPIQIDEPAFEDAGLTRDEHISINVQNVSLRSALRLLLKPKQLTYLLRDEVLIITTPEEAESDLVTCVYDVCDLVETDRNKSQKGASAVADFDSLIDSITSCVAIETWAENGGGQAEIRPLPSGLLVISQTDTVHEEVANLLAAVRATLKSRKTVPAAAAADGQGATKTFGIRGDGFGRGSEFGMEPEPASSSDESTAK